VKELARAPSAMISRPCPPFLRFHKLSLAAQNKRKHTGRIASKAQFRSRAAGQPSYPFIIDAEGSRTHLVRQRGRMDSSLQLNPRLLKRSLHSAAGRSGLGPFLFGPETNGTRFFFKYFF